MSENVDSAVQPLGEEAAEERVSGLKVGALGAWTATGLAVAAFIPAASIATVPTYAAAVSGNATWLALALAALGTTAVALAVIVFARRMVVTGALYSYINVVFGSRTSLVSAAALLLAYLLGTAFIVINATIYMISFLVGLGFTWGNSILTQSVVVAFTCLIGGGLSYFGIEASAKVSILLLVVTFPLVVAISVGIPLTDGFELSSQLSLKGFSFSGVMKGVAIGAAVIILFESSAATAVETTNPRKVVPRILLAIPLGLGGLYVLAAFLQIPVLPKIAEQTDAGASPIAAMADHVGLGALDHVTDLSLAVALISAGIAFTNYGSRVIATMATDGTLPSTLGKVHRRYRTPHVATCALSVVIAVATIAMLLVNDGDAYAVYNFSASVYTFCVVIPYILVCVGAVVLVGCEGSARSRILVVTSAFGIAVFVWIYVSAFVYPAGSPLNWMPYVFAVVLVIVVGAMSLSRRSNGLRASADPGKAE